MKYIISYYLRIALALIMAGLLLFSGVSVSLDRGIENLPAPQVQAADSSSPVELTENRTATSKLFYLGDTPDGRHRYAIDSYIGAIHYQDASGTWQDIDTAYSESDSGLYTAKFTKLPYLVRMGDDGTRRIYPDRNDLSYWIDIGKPFTTMPQPTKLGNTWTWNWTNASISVTIANTVVKFDFLLKNSSAPTSLTVPFSTNGIIRQGNLLYHNGTVVAELRKPFAVDAVGTERDVAVSFGSGSVTISLDPVGLTYPVSIDPTINVAVGASTDDCIVVWNGSAWSIKLTDNGQFVGYYNATNQKIGGGMLFKNITVPNSATITSANFSGLARTSYANTIVNSVIIGEDTDNATTFSTIENYQGRRGTIVGGANDNNITTANVTWNSIPAWTAGADKTSPDISTIVQEIINRFGWVNGYSIVIFWDDHAGSGTQSSLVCRSLSSKDGDAANPPTIHIEYTTGGISAPTVTSVSSSLVEETTASCTGNITATGGENASQRGIQYGYTTATYTANVTETGSFGVGLFTDNLTGLNKGATVFWRAFASNSVNMSFGSELTFHSKPDEPTGLTATAGNQQVDLAWTKGAGSENTTLYVREGTPPLSRDDPFATLIYDNTGTSYTNVGLTNGLHYYYCAWALSINGTLSQYSDAYASADAVPVTAPSVDSLSSSAVEETQATCTGNVTDAGGLEILERGFQFGYTTGIYTDNVSDSGSFTAGEFTDNLTGLNKGDVVYWRAFAGSANATGYGGELEFITKPDPATNFRSTDNGTTWIFLEWVNGTGMYAVEVRYAIGGAPADNVSGTLGYWGSGISANVTGLLADTTYDFRIFTHAYGDGLWSTADGNPNCQDKTDAVGVPTVITNATTLVEETTATVSGNITATSENCTAVNFEIGISPGVYTDNHTTIGSYGLGEFTHDLIGLTEGEAYYVRASANNTSGWGFGSEVSFITKPDPATGFHSTNNGTTWIFLEWVNGAGEYVEEIRYDTTSAPADNVSGTLGFYGSATSANITGLSDNTTYYFTIFTHAYDGGLWSTADSNPNCQDTTDLISAPTVITNPAYDVEETLSTLSGNITATGGEDASLLAFQWDTDSGEPYTNNTTISISHGIGEFHETRNLFEGELYYYRAGAMNSAGWGWGGEELFLMKPDEPTNLTSPSHWTTWIFLDWDIGAGSDNTVIRYRTDGTYPTDHTDGTLGYSGGADSANITGLADGTEHKFVAWSYCTEGGLEQWSDITANITVTTDIIGVATVTTDNATLVEETTATLNGTIVNIGGGDNCTAWRFQWGTTSGVYTDNYTDNGTFGNGYSFNYNLALLTEGEAYYFVASANNTEGWGYGIEQRFLTKPVETSGINLTPHADNITIEWNMPASADKALVLAKQGDYPTGIADPAATTVYFAAGNNTTFTGLDNNETWYFKIWGYATEDGMEQYSDSYTFGFTTTLKEAPIVTNDGGASGITDVDATLNGEITDTGGENPSVWVYYDTADGGTDYTVWTNNVSLGVEALGTFHYDIVGTLTPSTLYYYRMRAVNSMGFDWADTSANFTTTATPIVLDPPTNFIAVDMGSTTANLTWTTGIGALQTLIRASRIGFPTSITDGELVYIGAGIYTNDIGLSLDTTTYYYSAWSENSGNYSLTYATASVGGKGMVLFGFIGLGGILIFATIKTRNILFSLATSIVFIFLLFYTRANPIAGVTVGSTVDTIWMGICVAVFCGVPFMTWRFRNKDRARMEYEKNQSEEGESFIQPVSESEKASEAHGQSLSSRHGTSGRYADSADEYQAKIHGILHPRNRRRR